jgi:TPR repeat
MKRLSFFLLLVGVSCGAVAQNFAELLQNGKDMVRAERQKYAQEKPDYSDAINVLEQAAKLKPKDPEVHYFLGSAYDYNNSPDGSKLNQSNKDGAMRSSREFETVIKLSPKYTGEIIALDPYSKLSSIWGSLGYSYVVSGKKDSARWAFTEGKKHGAFSDFALAFYRYSINNCAKNAIYFTFGDFSTMNLWYLQEMENLRTDVTVINLSMIQIQWYTEFLSKMNPTLFSSPKIASDTNLYFDWKEKVFSIPMKNTGKFFEWTVKPTFDEGYIYRCDKMLIDIITHNKFIRTVYFEKGCDPKTIGGLEEHMKDCFTKDMLVLEESPKRGKEFFDYFKTYPFDIFKKTNTNSDVEMFNATGVRYEFLQGIYLLINDDKIPEAKKLYQQLVATFPESRFPYTDEKMEGYMKAYKEKLE